MATEAADPSPRQAELLELAYRYALERGLADLSLRPLAAAVGSSPRVLLYLFDSKDGLVRALLARARSDELDLLNDLRRRSEDSHPPGLADLGAEVWEWLAAEDHRALLTLWIEAYARSLVDRDGPWADFARATVHDWLAVLADAQPAAQRDTESGLAERTLVLAVLRGALLDLLATGDLDRTTSAVHQQLRHLTNRAPRPRTTTPTRSTSTPGALAMPAQQPYDIHLDDKFGHLAHIDLAAEAASHEPWFNQTLTSVNNAVVRLGVIEGDFHWHKHGDTDEFFLVLDGQLHIDLEDRDSVALDPHQGITIPKGVVHRTRALRRTSLLMIEAAGVSPTGD